MYNYVFFIILFRPAFLYVCIYLFWFVWCFLMGGEENEPSNCMKSVLTGLPHSSNALIISAQQTVLSGLRSGTSNQVLLSTLIPMDQLFFLDSLIQRVTKYFCTWYNVSYIEHILVMRWENHISSWHQNFFLKKHTPKCIYSEDKNIHTHTTS